jgi:hypothetical protein
MTIDLRIVSARWDMLMARSDMGRNEGQNSDE